jgi:hypothetical protein
MPPLNENTILPHLEAVIRGGRHWLFFTDCAQGQAWLTGLRIGLSRSLPESQVGYGVFGLIDSATGLSSTASFVTCPKQCPPHARFVIRALLSSFGFDPDDAGEDIILLSREKEPLGSLVQSIADGSTKTLTHVGWN